MKYSLHLCNAWPRMQLIWSPVTCFAGWGLATSTPTPHTHLQTPPTSLLAGSLLKQSSAALLLFWAQILLCSYLFSVYLSRLELSLASFTLTVQPCCRNCARFWSILRSCLAWGPLAFPRFVDFSWLRVVCRSTTRGRKKTGEGCLLRMRSAMQ